MVAKYYPVSKSTCIAVTLSAALLSGVCLTGCATSSSARVNAVMNKIKQGETTKEEIRELLGEPTGISKNVDGMETWMYSSNDMGNKMARQSVLTGAKMLLYRLPVIGSALGTAASGVTTSRQKTVIESTVINFDQKGVVTTVSTSSQTTP